MSSFTPATPPMPLAASETTSFHAERISSDSIINQAKSKFRARFIDSFRVEKGVYNVNSGLSNFDLEPVPIQNRNWNWKTYASYWVSESWGATVVAIGSAMVASGLLWWQALIACAIAHVTGAVLTVINCVCG